MKVVCIIPARGNSKGIPKKNLMPLAGKPLVAWSILQAKQSSLVNEVYVSSDSEEILSVAQNYGAIPIKRPDEISGDTASSESALLHAYDFISKNGPVDYIVFLQPTSPVRMPDDIDKAIQSILKDSADSLLSVKALKDYFIWQKKSQGDQSLQAVNFDYKHRKRRQELPTTYLENGSIYIFKPELLLTEKNRLGGKITFYEMDPSCSFQIDEPSEVKICEYFLTQLYESQSSKEKT